MTFTIKEKLPGLNDYTEACRNSKFGGGNMKRDTQDIIKIRMRGQNVTPIDGEVFFRFEWHEATKKRDKDNVAFAKKFILDALQEEKIIPSDGNDVVIGFEDTFRYDGWDGVRVTLEPAKKAKAKEGVVCLGVSDFGYEVKFDATGMTKAKFRKTLNLAHLNEQAKMHFLRSDDEPYDMPSNAKGYDFDAAIDVFVKNFGGRK